MPPGALRDAADDYTKGTDTMDVWFDSGTFRCTISQNLSLQTKKKIPTTKHRSTSL
jgi:isoleucyl-tRNA synthetase